METRTLQIFNTVAKTGSISRAAEELRCVQSNVSARIKHLEEELGVKLFYRRSKGVVLTSAGKTLRSYTTRIIHLVNEAEKAMQKSAEAGGCLVIGSMETTASVRLPQVLVRFRKALPNVKLQIETGHTVDLVRKILNYELDGAFVGGEIDHEEIVQQHVYTEELVLICANEIDSAADIANQELLVFGEGCAYRARADQWLSENGRISDQVMEFNSVDTILGCAAAGMGVTLLPRSVVERPQYQGLVRLHTLPEPISNVSTYFIRHRSTTVTEAMSRLLELAGES